MPSTPPSPTGNGPATSNGSDQTGASTCDSKARLPSSPGTAGGIGRATAVRFAEEGAAIVGADVTEAANDETARLVQDAGGKMIGVTVDVADSDSVATLFATPRQQFGRVDIIFNNAGVMLPGDDDARPRPTT